MGGGEGGEEGGVGWSPPLCNPKYATGIHCDSCRGRGITAYGSSTPVPQIHIEVSSKCPL